VGTLSGRGVASHESPSHYFISSPFFYFVRANSRCRIGARLVDKATADDDAPTPGYLYNDLASAPPLSFSLFFLFVVCFVYIAITVVI
jgi:hypothetical protein